MCSRSEMACVFGVVLNIAYHKSMRLTSFLSSVVETTAVSISVTGGLFSPSSTVTGCSTNAVVFIAAAL